MADMNHLSLRQEPQSTEIDTDEILREFGLEDAVQTSTIVQQNNTIVSIPNELEPPIIDTFEEITTSQRDMPEDIALNAMENSDLDATLDALLEASNSIHVNTDSHVDTNNIEQDTNSSTQESSETSENNNTEETPMLSTEELLGLLPVNSKSFEIDDSISRFSGAEWFNAIQETVISLAGLGGIGGYVYYCLTRMKPKQIFIYDDDIVETANLSGQMYSTDMIGKTKVDAMAKLGQDFSMYYSTVAIPTKFTATSKATDIMICGFDNMMARSTFFNSWLNHVNNSTDKEKCLYIDGRLTMERFQVFCIRGDDSYNIHRYATEYLFMDTEAEQEVCSMKQTTYCSNMIGSIIVNLFTNFVANVLTTPKPLIDRDLPFKTYYDAGMMYFKTEI